MMAPDPDWGIGFDSIPDQSQVTRNSHSLSWVGISCWQPYPMYWLPSLYDMYAERLLPHPEIERQ